MKNLCCMAAALCLFFCATAQDNTPWPSTGDVGIGTSPAAVPKAALEIKRTVSGGLGPVLRLTGGGNFNAQVAIDLATYDAAAAACRITAIDNGNFGCSLDFRTRTSGSDVNPLVSRLFISDNGNLGIGNVVPQGKLHIVENNNTASLILESNSAGWGSGMYFKNTAPSGRGYGIYTSSYGSLNIADVAAQVDRIFIAANGNVGVGTNQVSDVNYKFFVGGAIRARKVRVDQDVWSDYVFATGYVLRPLDEVERFIKKYQHLPDVPSAGEVKKEGIDLGENQAVMLKKIEELTLYIIEQQKQIDKERSEMKQLQQQVDELQKAIKRLAR